jgi:hypothetical protein
VWDQMTSKVLSSLLPLESMGASMGLDLSQPFPLLAVAVAACVVVFLGVVAVTGRGRKDAPPVVGGNLPIFGHFFLFLKSPINLVREDLEVEDERESVRHTHTESEERQRGPWPCLPPSLHACLLVLSGRPIVVLVLLLL